MSRLSALWLTGLLALPTLAQERWAVVVDRSGSMQVGDPDGRGLEALGLALVLAADPEAEVTVFGAEDARFPLAEGPTRLLEHLATLGPRPGGADLIEQIARARASDARVLVFSDDALDVVGKDGRVPERWLRAAGERPTREAVNAAARAALEGTSGGEVLALRAPLPDAARATPYLEGALDARVVDFDPEASERAITALASLLTGKPVMEPLELGPEETRLAPGFAARALVRSQRPLQLDGTRLDGRGTTWLLDVGADGVELGQHGGAVCYLAPEARLPADLQAYGLDGAVRVQASAPPAGGALVLVAEGGEFPFSGSPPGVQAEVSPASPLNVELRVGAEGFVADARALEALPVKLSLTREGTAQVGQPLLLRGALTPPGFDPGPLRLEVRVGSGEPRALTLDADRTASLVPEAPGRVTVTSPDAIPLEFAALVVAPEAVPPRLRLSLIRDAEAQALGQVLRTTEEELTLQVKVAAEPPYPAPVQASFALEGAEGVTLVAEPFEVKDETTATLRLRWPSAPGDRASLTLVATAQSATPAVGRHTVHLQHPVSLLRRYLGWALILLAVISVVAYVLQRRFRAYMEARMGKRQLRGIDAQGKISVERYSFLENSREDEVVEIAPELTQSSVELIVEDDGSVRASVSGRAKLVHERDPTRFVETTPLKHGDSFAVVEGNRARRFVYLEDEPSADELERSVAADRETAEAELRDSGVYVLLDEHQNVAPLASVIDPASEHLFPSADELDPYPTPSERLDRAVSDDFDGWPSASERMERVDDSPALPRPTVGLADDDDLVLDDDLLEDSVDELAFVPTSEDGPMVSDEGVVWLGSDEAEILDSDEAAAIDADTDVSDLPKGL